MSLHEYQESLRISRDDPPFYAIIMAAMRKADTDNAARLRAAFPDTWAELQERYNAPGGLIGEEVKSLQRCTCESFMHRDNSNVIIHLSKRCPFYVEGLMP